MDYQGWEFTPAENADRYNLVVEVHRLDDQRHYLQLKVRGCKKATVQQPEIVCGDWSQKSDPFYVPEAPQMLALPVLLLALVALRWRREIRKQLIDQPLHVIMNVASTLAIASPLFYGGIRTLWSKNPEALDLLYLSAMLGFLGTLLWNAIREYNQWPPGRWEGGGRRWWDPPLDWLFELGGMVLGTWIFVRWVAPALRGLL